MPLARGSLKKADEGGEWGEKGRVKEGLNRLPCGLWREIYLDKGGGIWNIWWKMDSPPDRGPFSKQGQGEEGVKKINFKK